MSDLATPSIVGDVTVDKITLNKKGGSLAAILKRPIRGSMDTSASSCFGAKMEFTGGQTCVLLAPHEMAADASAKKGPRIHVTRVAPNRFMVDLLAEGEAVTIDPLTEAALTIVQEQIKRRETDLIDADEAMAAIDELRETLSKKAKAQD